jgi:hypothetical protein
MYKISAIHRLRLTRSFVSTAMLDHAVVPCSKEVSGTAWKSKLRSWMGYFLLFAVAIVPVKIHAYNGADGMQKV